MERLWTPRAFHRRRARGRLTDDVCAPHVAWCGQSPLEQGPVGNPNGSGLPLTPGNVPNLALWSSANQGIVFGGMEAAIATGTTPPAVTFTGTPSATVQSFDMTCTVIGILGTSHVNININGASVYAGVSAASLGPFSGITVHIAAGAMALNDEWTSVPSVASWTSIDASATVFAQATQAAQPAWIAPGLVLSGWPAGANGLATVRFNPAGSQFLSNSTFAVAQPFTFYCLDQSSASQTGNGGILDDAGGSFILIVQAGSVDRLVTANGVANYVQVIGGGGATAFTTAQLDSGILNGGASQCPIAHAFYTDLGAGGIVGGLNLGTYSAANFYFGDISELVIYSAAVTVAQDNSVKAYFCSRYALA